MRVRTVLFGVAGCLSLAVAGGVIASRAPRDVEPEPEVVYLPPGEELPPAPPRRPRPVSLNVDATPISDVLRIVAEQQEFELDIADDVPPEALAQKASITMPGGSLEDVLSFLGRITKLECTLDGERIVVRKP